MNISVDYRTSITTDYTQKHPAVLRHIRYRSFQHYVSAFVKRTCFTRLPRVKLGLSLGISTAVLSYRQHIIPESIDINALGGR